MFSKFVGKLLRNLRKLRGYKIKDIAKFCRKTGSYISKLERGKIKEPSLVIILNYLRGLQVSYSEFFKEIEDWEMNKILRKKEKKEKYEKDVERYLVGIKYPRKTFINFPKYLAAKIKNYLLPFNLSNDLIEKYINFGEEFFHSLLRIYEGKEDEKVIEKLMEKADKDGLKTFSPNFLSEVMKIVKKWFKRELKRRRCVKPITDRKIKKMVEGYQRYMEEWLNVEGEAKKVLFNKGIKILDIKSYLNILRKYHSLKRKGEIKKLDKFKEDLEKEITTAQLDKDISRGIDKSS
ncbi:MAG: helix-turn-helix domain-containing protein [candidate division WOR-3 bacterium]